MNGELDEQPTGLRRAGFWAGPFAFFALLWIAPDALDGAQTRVAAITAWTAIWWITEAIPVGATSLLPAVLLPALGVMGGREVAPVYMHDIVFLFLGAFVVSLGLERWNVHRRLAMWLIARVGTSPRRLVLGFMAAAASMSMFLNNTATTLMLLPIGLAVVASVEGKHRAGLTPFGTALLLGMAYSASVGGTGSLVGTAPNQVFAAQFAELFPSAPSIDFAQWLVAFGPLVVIFVPLGWWLLTRVAQRVPAGGGTAAATVAAQRQELGRMSTAEKRMAAIFVLTALLWITRAGFDLGSLSIPGWVSLVLPAGVPSPKTFLTDATVATAMAIVCFVVPAGGGDRRRLMDWKTASRLPWEVLLLLGAGFLIAESFKVTGLDQSLGSALAPLLAGRPEWFIVFLIVVFMALLTEITSNTATTIVLLPVLGQAGIAAGVSPLVTMLPATIAASCAFMLPVATPPNAVVFASRLVDVPTMVRVGIWMNLLMAVLIPLYFETWVTFVLEIDSALPAWVER